MANEMIERTWSKKEYKHTIGIANQGVKGLLTLKNGFGKYTQEQQDFAINCAIDNIVRVIWKLTTREKRYKEFKKDYLEAMKEESES